MSGGELGPIAQNAAQVYEDVRGILAPEWQVFDTIPESLVPPCVVIGPADPWLADGEVFGDAEINYELTVIVPNATNQVMRDQLFSVIEILYPALREEGYGITVESPKTLPANGTRYLAGFINLVSTTQIN